MFKEYMHQISALFNKGVVMVNYWEGSNKNVGWAKIAKMKYWVGSM